jgi:hypothetical protein
MTFEPVVELNSNALCQRLISGKGLGRIRPKPRSRACRLAALVAVSAAIGAGGRVRVIPADESWPVREVKSILKDG